MSCKCHCSLDMMDKVEPPAVADGYGLSVAFVCMLDIVVCIGDIIKSLSQPVAETTPSSTSTPDVPLMKPTAECVNSTPDTGISELFCIVSEWVKFYISLDTFWRRVFPGNNLH